MGCGEGGEGEGEEGDEEVEKHFGLELRREERMGFMEREIWRIEF